MSSFTGPLTLTHLDLDWRLWQIERPFVYEVGALGSGRRIDIPVGFQTDGASVPQWLWSVLPVWGSYSRAAVVHDYLLSRLASGVPHPEGMDRNQCDAVFWEAMGVTQTPMAIRSLLYAGVRSYTGWLQITKG